MAVLTLNSMNGRVGGRGVRGGRKEVRGAAARGAPFYFSCRAPPDIVDPTQRPRLAESWLSSATDPDQMMEVD